MKIYDTNLSKFDCMVLKTCLVFYLFANCEQDKAGKVTLMLGQLIDGLQNITLFVRELNEAMDRYSQLNNCLDDAYNTTLTTIIGDFWRLWGHF